MLTMLSEKLSWPALRYGLVFLTWGVVTWNYFSFSHYVHQPHHFGPPDGNQTQGGNVTHKGRNHYDDGDHDKSDENEDGDHHDEHGKGGSFDSIHLSKDGLFLYGLALPLVMLTLASLIWNPSTSTKGNTTKGTTHTDVKIKSKGEVNVRKWTIIWFVIPLVLVMCDAAWGHGLNKYGDNLYIRICMSLMSTSGYSATWALSLFLIPVTKHSPILDWLRVTPIQALAFHRVTGWTGFWYSVLHGYLHLRHLMDVLNPGHTRPWYEQLKILLIPSSWDCLWTQSPWSVFWGRQDPYDGSSEDAQQCWLALVNATGMISVIAFALLAATSLPQVRRYSYTLFYRVHIPSAWIMLINAIWHYPTCALILIPNIIYYLSFNIPVYATQTIDSWSIWRQSKRDDKPKKSALVEAKLIQGGSIELVFAKASKDHPRYESHYVRLSCPSVSPLSHPFSVFSRHDLMDAKGTSNNDDSSLTTFSILLRPKGPFTEGLTNALFPNCVNDETNPQEKPLLSNCDINGNLEKAIPLSESSPDFLTAALSSHHKIQVDSYYAGSFDWINRAMTSHDEILVVAGGVGIVPFLKFLPSLQQRIEMDSAAAATSVATMFGEDYEGSLVDSEALLKFHPQVGPNRVHLHWYCREVGLASYVWYNHLRDHVEQSWENNPVCQGRLKIHLHLTSLSTAEGEDTLRNIGNLGLIKKYAYVVPGQQDSLRPVQDARFTQSLWLGMLLPGSLIVAGTFLHWWWYEQFIVNEKYMHDNLIIRSHSIIFTLLLAMVVSFLVEYYLRYCDKVSQIQHSALVGDSDTDSSSDGTASTGSIENQYQSQATMCPGSMNTNPTFLTVTGGRPPMETVIDNIIKADHPGVYMCGSHSLMESVENVIRSKRTDCAFYSEDSEM